MTKQDYRRNFLGLHGGLLRQKLIKSKMQGLERRYSTTIKTINDGLRCELFFTTVM